MLMNATRLSLFCIVGMAAAVGFAAEPAVRYYGATNLPAVGYQSPGAVAVAGTSSVVTADPTYVAFGHGRACCGNAGYYGGYGAGFNNLYNAYSTYQPSYYSSYAVGYGGNYANYNPAYAYRSPNPYGYYQNGQIWGSSGPWYGRPFPVWNSPSGDYSYRYNGWGSYGWGGWGGTGPAGWGYQGGFYW